MPKKWNIYSTELRCADMSPPRLELAIDKPGFVIARWTQAAIEAMLI